MFDRALVFVSPEGSNDSLLPALEQLLPGTATVFELRTIPAHSGWAEPRRIFPGRVGPAGSPERPGIPRRILKRTADPARAILDLVDELGIDLVALEDGPSSGGRRFRNSGVAEKIINSGRVPVLVVSPSSEPKRSNLSRLLLPFDPFLPSRLLLETASQLGRRSQAEVVVLGLISVSFERPEAGIIFDDGPLRKASPEERITHFARDLVALGCRVRTMHAYQDPIDAVSRTARSLDADMVLLGKLGSGVLEPRAVDGLSRQLAASVECPILFGASGWRGHRRALRTG